MPNVSTGNKLNVFRPEIKKTRAPAIGVPSAARRTRPETCRCGGLSRYVTQPEKTAATLTIQTARNIDLTISSPMAARHRGPNRQESLPGRHSVERLVGPSLGGEVRGRSSAPEGCAMRPPYRPLHDFRC